MNLKTIPRIIHYCWFGGNALPSSVIKCIHSWESNWKDCEIVRWDENNFDIERYSYCREAYMKEAWAYVSDLARLAIIYEHGGVYLDTDVEMIKSIDPLLAEGVGFIGFQNEEQVSTGLGFSAAPGNRCVRAMLEVYKDEHYGGDAFRYPCPVYNTAALIGMGLKTGSKESKSIQALDGMNVFPVSYFNPIDADKKNLSIDETTYLINHYGASWLDVKSMMLQKMKKLIPGYLLRKRTKYISKRDVTVMLKMKGIIAPQ